MWHLLNTTHIKLRCKMHCIYYIALLHIIIPKKYEKLIHMYMQHFFDDEFINYNKMLFYYCRICRKCRTLITLSQTVSVQAQPVRYQSQPKQNPPDYNRVYQIQINKNKTQKNKFTFLSQFLHLFLSYHQAQLHYLLT